MAKEIVAVLVILVGIYSKLRCLHTATGVD